MKKKNAKKENARFVEKLKKDSVALKKMRTREIKVFNVMANFGSYQITVGPEYSPEECEKFHFKPHSRMIEIRGSMHHLFVNPRKVSPLPEQEEVRRNLKGTVIMRDIAIHIVDKDGGGTTVEIERLGHNGVHARNNINLAGENGESMVERFQKTGRLANETYRIVQEDILKALKHR